MTVFVALNQRTPQQTAGGTTQVAVDAWCKAHFQRDLFFVAQLLSARFSAAFLVLRIVGGNRLFVRARLYQATVHMATIALRFDPAGGRTHLSWFVVARTGRGGTVSRHLLQNLLLLERDCGTTRLSLEAALTHGGYVWAVHGFLPASPAAWATLSARLAAKFAALAAGLSPVEVQAVNKLLAAPEPAALRAIAAIPTLVNGTPLGKLLLMGERWPGELDLFDEPSVTIYLRRIGLIP
ncbi:MAG: hypothetical protein JOY81_13535 [Alphaproteobacteria bacterium]|nr:hypothetical protein [Alphaproteobacteria bacterium]